MTHRNQNQLETMTMMMAKDNVKIICAILGVLSYGLPLITNSVFLDEFYGIGTTLIIGVYFVVDSIPLNSNTKSFTISAGVFFLGLCLILAIDTFLDELFYTYWWVVLNFIITIILWSLLFFSRWAIRH